MYMYTININMYMYTQCGVHANNINSYNSIISPSQRPYNVKVFTARINEPEQTTQHVLYLAKYGVTKFMSLILYGQFPKSLFLRTHIKDTPPPRNIITIISAFLVRYPLHICKGFQYEPSYVHFTLLSFKPTDASSELSGRACI